MTSSVAPREGIDVKLTGDLVRRFEQLMAESVASLITHSLRVPGNPEGYALFQDGSILAMLSTNPHAGWATQTYGLTGQSAEAVRRVIDFFRAHQVPACVRIVPHGFTAEQADVLGEHGLRHTDFQAIAWSPLPLRVDPVTTADVREVSSTEELDAHIDINLGAYGAPPAIIDRLRPLASNVAGHARPPAVLGVRRGTAGRAGDVVLEWRDRVPRECGDPSCVPWSRVASSLDTAANRRRDGPRLPARHRRGGVCEPKLHESDRLRPVGSVHGRALATIHVTDGRAIDPISQ